MFYDELLIDCFHRMQQSRSVRIRQVTEPPGSLSENDLPAAFLSSFAFVKLSTDIDLGIHRLDTEHKLRAACKCLSSSLCGGKITCAACLYLCRLSTGEQTEE